MGPIGITTIAKKKQLPSWKRTQLAITLASLILFGFVVVLFLFINPLVAVVLSELGGLVGLALV